MKIKHIVIILLAGVMSFSTTFSVSYYVRKMAAVKKQQAEALLEKREEEAEKEVVEIDGSQVVQKDSLTEVQLKDLLFDVREKIREYDRKLDSLDERELHFKSAQGQLTADIEKLDSLRVEVASMVAEIKQQQDALEESRISIEQTELENLSGVAATYDAMEADSASKIFVSMSEMNFDSPTGHLGIDEVVKILFYMDEGKRAEVLGALVNNQAQLAVVLTEKLKRINEVQ